MPVDQYIGGIEHAVLHLLYARFFTKVIRDLGLVKVNEPFTNLLTQGMVCMETFRCEEHGWLFPGKVPGSEKEGWRCPHCGRSVERGRVEKMSKSKKNIVDPEQLIAKYGADTARLFSLFAAPPEKDLEWNDAGVEGAARFLNRVWRLAAKRSPLDRAGVAAATRDGESKRAAPLRRATHQTIRKVTEDLDHNFQFNTAIAALMELYNTITEREREGEAAGDRAAMDEAVRTLVILMAPFAPHIAEELWKRLGRTDGVLRQPWPIWNEAYLKTDEVTIVLQINGKVRSQIRVPADLDEEAVRSRALADGKIMDWMKGQPPKKVIYVKGKLVNIVL
jgi:leucyl-tRNA synthetase